MDESQLLFDDLIAPMLLTRSEVLLVDDLISIVEFDFVSVNLLSFDSFTSFTFSSSILPLFIASGELLFPRPSVVSFKFIFSLELQFDSRQLESKLILTFDLHDSFALSSLLLVQFFESSSTSTSTSSSSPSPSPTTTSASASASPLPASPVVGSVGDC